MTTHGNHVVMLGTGVETRGGIATVVSSYRSHGLFERWPIRYVATHRDGSPLEKLATAVKAFFVLLLEVIRHPGCVMHVHGASRASFWRKSVYMAVGTLFGCRIVFHLHGGGFARFHREECGPFAQAVIRFFFDHAAWIVVVSESWRQWAHTVTSNRHVACIPHPVTLPAVGADKREYGLIVFSGRCEASKGIFDLLEAAGVLRAQIPGLRIECAGDGDLGKVKRYAAAMNLDSRVTLRGWLGRDAAEEILGRASVFVLPSYAEGLPMSLLEAMAAGCPVVATRVGGIPDLVTDGVDGLLVPPGDPVALAAALQRILRDPAFARQLGNAARRTVADRYAAERSLERLEQIYAGLGVCRAAKRKGAPAPTLQEMS